MATRPPNPAHAHPAVDRPHAVAWGSGLAGFAFGGFADGILLHQILQWHHLLIGVTDPNDLRFQVMADGWFHAAMYAVGLVGLAILWTVRTGLVMRGAGARLLAWFLIGFGVWHVVDAVLVHWILGLHRIRPESDDVLFWDLAFFALGIAFVLAGLGARRATHRIEGAAATIAAITLAAGLLALEPFADRPDTVVFARSVSAEAAYAAIAGAGGRVVAARPEAGVWQVSGAAASHLARAGVVFIGSGPLAPACLSAPPDA